MSNDSLAASYGDTQEVSDEDWSIAVATSSAADDGKGGGSASAADDDGKGGGSASAADDRKGDGSRPSLKRMGSPIDEKFKGTKGVAGSPNKRWAEGSLTTSKDRKEYNEYVQRVEEIAAKEGKTVLWVASEHGRFMRAEGFSDFNIDAL